jgi:cytochrome P450
VQTLFRTATKDTQVGDATIKAGDSALVYFAAANRDPEMFPNPDEFRLDRDLHNHVAFGMGIHYCLGSPLARAEAKVTLNAWLDRFERIEPGSEPGKRLGGMPIIYGFRELPLLLRA